MAEYSIWWEMRTVKLWVSTVDEMKILRRAIKKDKLDLELDDEVIKWSWLVRFYTVRPKNEFEYLISMIDDSNLKNQFEIVYKERREANRICGISNIFSAWQRKYLKRENNDVVVCDSADWVIELLQPFMNQ